MKPLPWFLLSLLCISGCAGRLDKAVRKRAASDFACPSDKLAVQEVEARAWNSGTYQVQGCERSETFYSVCSLLYCTTRTTGERAHLLAAQDAEREAALADRGAPSGDDAYSDAGAQPDRGGGYGAPPPRSSDPPARSAAPPSRPAAPPSPKFVSMRLQNLCDKKVKLFHGRDPKYGSGRTDSIGANTIFNVSGKEGDMLWIVDDRNNGMSSFSLSSGVRELYINKMCTGFTTSR